MAPWGPETGVAVLPLVLRHPPKGCPGPQGTTSFARKEVTALVATCEECGRVFDLLDEDDAAEYAYGHDCEVE